MEFIEENPNLIKSWRLLSTNSNITMDIVKKNPDKPWCWIGLTENENMTWDIIQENPNGNWNYQYLSRKSFSKEKQIFMQKKYREHMAAFKIQMYWRRANYNPDYKLCKQRLIKQCNEFGFK